MRWLKFGKNSNFCFLFARAKQQSQQKINENLIRAESIIRNIPFSVLCLQCLLLDTTMFMTFYWSLSQEESNNNEHGTCDFCRKFGGKPQSSLAEILSRRVQNCP
jgi:hypothetical protein